MAEDLDEVAERAEIQEEELVDFVLDWARTEGVSFSAHQIDTLRRAVALRNRPWIEISR